VLASNNQKKAREMRSLLPVEIDVITADEAGITLPEETGETFEDNALLKARAAATQARLLSVADDSGLEVDAIGGLPGVRSARFAADHGRDASDEENNRLLLESLANVPDSERTARFVSAVAIVSPDGDERVCRGTVEGRIGRAPVGEGGFGYDPLFYPHCHDRTMAQLGPEEKNAISHRGRAFRQAVPVIIEFSGK
jgi:XTP/dITP diphosphohydrolase